MAFNSKYVRYLAIGTELISSVLIPLLLGYFYDSHFQSKPVGISIGFILALVLSIRQLMGLVKEVSEMNNKHEN